MRLPSRRVPLFNRARRRLEAYLQSALAEHDRIDELLPEHWHEFILPDVRELAERYNPRSYTFQGYYQACATVAGEILELAATGHWGAAAETYRLYRKLYKYPHPQHWEKLVPNFVPTP